MSASDAPFGFFNVHKPVGLTSHDVVAAVRRGLRIKRVGHAGTLDPLAEGVLIVAVGQATRLLEYLVTTEKSYRARVQFGITTDTYDAEGAVLSSQEPSSDLTPSRIAHHLTAFRGTIQQVPPVYSSVKVKGKTAHARTRAGETLVLEPRTVDIYELTLLEYSSPIATLNVRCSAGTYIRSLAHDLGEAVGCGAHLAGLVRTAVGEFSIEEAIRLDVLRVAFESQQSAKYMIGVSKALEHMPKVMLTVEQAEDIRHGRPIDAVENPASMARAHLTDGRFVAILEHQPEQNQWKPKKVFTHLFE